MRFASAVELRLAHGYPADGRCRAFALEPTAETAARIRGLRGILRAQSDGVALLLPLGEGDRPLVPGAASDVLRFELRLRDAELPLYTDLDAYHAQEAPLFAGTAAGDGSEVSLALGSASAHGEERRSVTTRAASVALTLGGRPRPGSGAGDFEVRGADVRVVGYTEAARELRVDTRQAAAGAAFVLRYPTLAALEAGVFAQVVLSGASLLPARGMALAQPRRFRIELAARRARWVYYCVTDLAPEAGTLSVAAPAGASEPAPPFGVASELGAQDDVSDPIARGLAAQHPTLRRVRLVSDAAIACREAPRLLELHQGAARVRASLPNPSLRSFARLPLGASPEDVWFEIVRHESGRASGNGPAPP